MVAELPPNAAGLPPNELAVPPAADVPPVGDVPPYAVAPPTVGVGLIGVEPQPLQASAKSASDKPSKTSSFFIIVRPVSKLPLVFSDA